MQWQHGVIADVRYGALSGHISDFARLPIWAKSGNGHPASIYQLVGGHEQNGHWGNVWI
jgi:hypothetical protein